MWPILRRPNPKQSEPVTAQPQRDDGYCRTRMYEPGADHEHKRLATAPHPGLDHTCGHTAHRCSYNEIGERCCKTWPDPLVKLKDRLKPEPLGGPR